MNKQEVVMVIGPTGTGKSSIAQKYIDRGYIHLNRDTEGGGTLDLIPKMSMALSIGHSVILDNTHLTPERRVPFINAAGDVPVNGFVLKTSKADAQVNIVTRLIKMGVDPMDLEAIKAHNSPNVYGSAVHFMHYKSFIAPTSEEGFASITYKDFERVIDPSYTNKALLVDYDNTLRISGGDKKYPTHPDDVILMAGRTEVLKEYQEEGYKILGVSNQSGVGKETFTYKEAEACFDRTNELLGVDIEYLFCPHRAGPIQCWCRKPMPGMGIMFIEKYKLDRSQTIMVGDMKTDETFAGRCGFKFEYAADFFNDARK